MFLLSGRKKTRSEAAKSSTNTHTFDGAEKVKQRHGRVKVRTFGQAGWTPGGLLGSDGPSPPPKPASKPSDAFVLKVLTFGPVIGRHRAWLDRLLLTVAGLS